MTMNVATAVRFYVDKIVGDPKISGQSAPRFGGTIGSTTCKCCRGVFIDQ